MFAVRGRVVEPLEACAHLLRRLKQAAEEFLDGTVTDAVLAVPGLFNVWQRQALRDAGRIAGLKVRRIINDSGAAGLVRCLDRKDELIAVYDLGGGAFEISILEVSEGLVEVKSINGDTHLGGDDIDQAVMEHLMAEFRKENGVDLTKDKTALQRVRDASEKAKIELSSMQETTVNLPYITAAGATPLHMNIRLTRARLEQMIDPLVECSIEACKRAIADSGRRAADINEVVLVGGSTRIPLVQKRVKEFFGKEPNRSVNPDEVVAVGAAVQGAILTGEVKDMFFLDVTPLSLSIETGGGISTAFIRRNTVIPTSKSEIFSTVSDNQTQVEVHVLQGECPMARDNKSLGRFQLTGIAPAPRGVPKIRVTFDIDSNGVLSVSAKDEATGYNHRVALVTNSAVSEAEIERLRLEARWHDGEDERRSGEAEARSECEAFTYHIERTLLVDGGSSLPKQHVARIEAAVLQARDAIRREDATAVEEAYERLRAEAQRALTLLTDEASLKDALIDAEFEET